MQQGTNWEYMHINPYKKFLKATKLFPGTLHAMSQYLLVANVGRIHHNRSHASAQQAGRQEFK